MQHDLESLSEGEEHWFRDCCRVRFFFPTGDVCMGLYTIVCVANDFTFLLCFCHCHSTAVVQHNAYIYTSTPFTDRTQGGVVVVVAVVSYGMNVYSSSSRSPLGNIAM